MPHADSTPLAALAAEARKPSSGGELSRLANFKVLAFLLAIFLFVQSTIFRDNFLEGLDGAVRGRQVTPYGTVVQGVTLVLFYVLAIHLMDANVV